MGWYRKGFKLPKILSLQNEGGEKGSLPHRLPDLGGSNQHAEVLAWGAASALPLQICLTTWYDSGLTQASRSLILQVTGEIPGVQAVGPRGSTCQYLPGWHMVFLCTPVLALKFWGWAWMNPHVRPCATHWRWRNKHYGTICTLKSDLALIRWGRGGNGFSLFEEDEHEEASLGNTKKISCTSNFDFILPPTVQVPCKKWFPGLFKSRGIVCPTVTSMKLLMSNETLNDRESNSFCLYNIWSRLPMSCTYWKLWKGKRFQKLTKQKDRTATFEMLLKAAQSMISLRITSGIDSYTDNDSLLNSLGLTLCHVYHMQIRT